MDDKQRIALVETRTAGTEIGVPMQLIRFQFGNHLGSAALELDDGAQIISYEEYTPYGSTSYQAVRSQTETPKRYRYTGKERDDESGLYYHVARYYAPWLGRWTSCDPLGLADGLNLYRYVRANPVVFLDPSGTNGDKWSEERLNQVQKDLPETQQRLNAEVRRAENLEKSEINAATTRDSIRKSEMGPIDKWRAERAANKAMEKLRAEREAAQKTITKLQAEIDSLAREEVAIKEFRKIHEPTKADFEAQIPKEHGGTAEPPSPTKVEPTKQMKDWDKRFEEAQKKGGGDPKKGGGSGGSGGGQGGGSSGGGQGGAAGGGGGGAPPPNPANPPPEGQVKSTMGGTAMGALGALAMANDAIAFFTGKDSLQFFDDLVKGGFGDPVARTRVGDNIFRVTTADWRAAADVLRKREIEALYTQMAKKEGVSVEEIKRRIKAQPRSNEGPSIGPGR
jgi:RHS repeat-associated protein